MRQNINLGSTVDDGQGDYIRRGGEKINDNFANIYEELGDGDRPFSAGAWHIHNAIDDGSVLQAEFGRAYAINTTNSTVSVELPSGSGSDFGKVIRLRDVWRSWFEYPVTIIPATGDTIKGSGNPFELFRNLQDIELVYTSPGRWEFIDNKLVNNITISDVPTVAKREYIAEEGQTDFSDIFSQPYEISNLEVYRRGNLLYYGDTFTEDSDFGSWADPEDQLIEGIEPLDGNTIRLREPCNSGDPITIISYSDNLASSRTSYNSFSIKVLDADSTEEEAMNGNVLLVNDLENKRLWTLEDFGRSEREFINPFSFELYINGRQLTAANEVGNSGFTCFGADGGTEEICITNGGEWVPQGEDYTILQNNDGKYERFYIPTPLESGDVVTVKWFDNQIGTVIEFEGEGGIRELTESVFMNTESTFNRSGKISYTDLENPTAQTAEQVTGEESNIRFDEIGSLLESIYPVGTVYKNAHNPNNPADYMGFGVWKRYAEGRALVGWDSSVEPYNPNFGLNNNDLDENNVPRHTAGGTGGNVSIQLEANQIPELQTTDQVLVVDETGGVTIGACQDDPDEEGPAIRNYREQTTRVNQGNTNPNNIETLTPYITVHVWVRVE